MNRHYSSIIFTCQLFQPSSISLIRVGNTFSISSLFDVTKLQKIVLMSHRLAGFHSQCQWTRIFLSLTTSMGLYLDLNGIERVIIYFSVPEKHDLILFLHVTPSNPRSYSC